MNTYTGREYGIIGRVLAEVASQPDVGVKVMRKLIRHVIDTVIAKDPLLLNPDWFHDQIIRKATELKAHNKAIAPAPEGVSPHTKVLSWDDLHRRGL
ncbi:MAG: hypothetical protein BMS9Abin10_0629 [Gammaproteobacteria bacterium]|nr:MAG: hypothetical protein BMS9Abin10_0629 [Gammaproteobacteria bacterium]